MLNLQLISHDDVIRFGKDLTIAAESVIVRLGPYDNSDYIEIERDEETREVRVLAHIGQHVECVFSVIEEEV